MYNAEYNLSKQIFSIHKMRNSPKKRTALPNAKYALANLGNQITKYLGAREINGNIISGYLFKIYQRLIQIINIIYNQY